MRRLCEDSVRVSLALFVYHSQYVDGQAGKHILIFESYIGC